MTNGRVCRPLFRGLRLLMNLSWSAGGVLAASPLAAQQPAVAMSAAAAAWPRDAVTAFVDVAVIPMDKERVLRNQTVVVRDGRIVALGPVGQVRVPAGAARIDGQGKFLMPGLSDMHTHEFPGADSLTRDYQLLTYLSLGITTVRDMHSGTPESDDGKGVLALKRRLAAGDLIGPHLYLAGDLGSLVTISITAEELEKAHFDIAKVGPEMAALKAAGYDFVKFTPYRLPRPLYDSIIAGAARAKLPVVGHVPGEGVGVRTALHDHWRSIEHLTGYFEEVIGAGGKHSLQDLGGDSDTAWMQPTFQPDPKLLRELAEATRQAGVWNCPTLFVPLTNFMMAEGGDTTDRRYLVAKRRWEFAAPIVRALRDAGAGMLLGTDGPPKFPGTSHRELELMVEAGLTPYQALETGTRNVAQFLGVLDSAGTVTTGKRADLVLLEANPLEDIRHSREIVGVMLGGRWLTRAELDASREALKHKIQGS